MAKQDKDGGTKRPKTRAGVAGAIKSAVAAMGSAVEGAASQVAHRRDEHSSGHAPAKAHGQATTVDESLPASRSELLDLHTEARRKRAAAPLGSDAYRDAADEVGRIEVEIARQERAMDPPKV